MIDASLAWIHELQPQQPGVCKKHSTCTAHLMQMTTMMGSLLKNVLKCVGRKTAYDAAQSFLKTNIARHAIFMQALLFSVRHG
jgi:hypothetical protein